MLKENSQNVYQYIVEDMEDTVSSKNAYVPGEAYSHFLKEKKKEGYISFIRNIRKILGVKTM